MVNTRVAQVNNVSSAATMEQLRTLFGFLGKIEDIRLFPKEDSVLPVTVRICFVRFEDATSVGMAQHLSNTVFLDKALNVVPFPDGVIPEESKALQMVAASSGGLVSMMNNAGASLLPTPPQPLLGQLSGAVTGVSVPTSVAPGLDASVAALGVPVLPQLSNVDPSKVEEIRRTVYVGNLDSATVTAEQLLTFFQKVGEVKYVRMAGDETQPTRFAFVEFSEPTSVANALSYNGVMFAGRPLKINHSNNAIVKPPGKTQDAIQKELAQTMKQVRDAQALIQAAIDPELKAAATKQLPPGVTADIKVPEVLQNHIKALMSSEVEKPKKKSRSRSPSKRVSRSRSSRRSRSRSRDRHRSRSRRSRSRGRRSRSPRRRSPIRRRSRSRSKHRRSRSKSRDKRSKSREKRKRSKTPPRSYRTRRSRSRSKGKKAESSRPRRRSRSPSPRRRSRSKSGSRSPRRSSKHRKDKKREKSRDRDRKDKESRSSSSRKKKEKESTEKESTTASATPGEAGDEKKDDKSDSKVKRDYDEEEKGFDSQEQEKAAPTKDEPPPAPDADATTTTPAATESGDNVNTEDMDMSD